MITIPVAAPNKLFQWQLSLFEYNQKKVYGDEAWFNTMSCIVDRNSHQQPISSVPWNISLPSKIVPGIHSILKKQQDHHYYVAANVFFALKPIIEHLHSEEVVCIIDCDVIPLKKYDGVMPTEDTVITCNEYEDWHMLMSKPGKQNYSTVEPFLKHDDHNYMDGGFIPILIKVSTLRRIIDDVIDLTIKIVDENKDDPKGWWCQMFAFQIAIHNHRIKAIPQSNTYFPGRHELKRDKHYFAHYSTDPKFKKGAFPRINFTEFPNNLFYERVLDWMYR